jgi:hypothetical protein
MPQSTPSLNTQKDIIREVTEILSNESTSDDIKFGDIIDIIAGNLTPDDVFTDEVLATYAEQDLGMITPDDEE